ncbi:hypothetical protein RB195_017107 [Necator americanus]
MDAAIPSSSKSKKALSEKAEEVLNAVGEKKKKTRVRLRKSIQEIGRRSPGMIKKLRKKRVRRKKKHSASRKESISAAPKEPSKSATPVNSEAGTPKERTPEEKSRMGKPKIPEISEEMQYTEYEVVDAPVAPARADVHAHRRRKRKNRKTLSSEYDTRSTEVTSEEKTTETYETLDTKEIDELKKENDGQNKLAKTGKEKVLKQEPKKKSPGRPSGSCEKQSPSIEVTNEEKKTETSGSVTNATKENIDAKTQQQCDGVVQSKSATPEKCLSVDKDKEERKSFFVDQPAADISSMYCGMNDEENKTDTNQTVPDPKPKEENPNLPITVLLNEPGKTAAIRRPEINTRQNLGVETAK